LTKSSDRANNPSMNSETQPGIPDAVIVVLEQLADSLKDLAARLATRRQPARPAASEAPLRGHRQQQIVRYLESRGGDGALTREISSAIGYAQPNVYASCEVLTERGVLAKISGARPIRYRLAGEPGQE
jgi:hypothetical protein